MPIGPVELGIILVIVLLLLGPGKLPETGAALGRGIRELRNGLSGRDELGPPAQLPAPDAAPDGVPQPSDARR